MANTIKILVVDDSVFMRQIITTILNSDPGIKVANTAKNGVEALEILKTERFDVITLDINMPRMDGITTLKHIMATNPTPVIMISALTQKDAKETLSALSIGAIDYVAKPSGSISLDINKQRDEIVAKVKAAAAAKLRRVRRPKPARPPAMGTRLGRRETAAGGAIAHRGDLVVAIGASTGGPATLYEIISALPKDLNASVFIVQHMPAMFTKSFANGLNASSEIAVKEAEDNEFINKSTVYVAMGSVNMLVKKEPGTYRKIIKIDTDTKTIFTPNVNLTFNSIVDSCNSNVIGVVITGMGNDGAEGLLKIKLSGGVTIAEDESTSVIFGMPREAIAIGAADYVLPADKIAGEIISLVKAKGR